MAVLEWRSGWKESWRPTGRSEALSAHFSRRGCPVRAMVAAGDGSAEPAGLQSSWAAQGCCLHLPISPMHPFSLQESTDIWEACWAIRGQPKRKNTGVASREIGLVFQPESQRNAQSLSWGPRGQLSVTWPQGAFQSPLTSQLHIATTFIVLQVTRED